MSVTGIPPELLPATHRDDVPVCSHPPPALLTGDPRARRGAQHTEWCAQCSAVPVSSDLPTLKRGPYHKNYAPDKRLEQTFPKVDTQTASEHVHRCPTSLVVRETHVKPAVSPLLPTRVAREVWEQHESGPGGWERKWGGSRGKPSGGSSSRRTQNDHRAQGFLLGVRAQRNGRQACKETLVYLMRSGIVHNG